MSPINLREAERIEIMVLVDNYIDVLLQENTKHMRRPKISTSSGPLAEHGLSCLITVYADSGEHVMLMDTGRTAKCLLHNIEAFEVDVDRVECVFLSHGHLDHFGGLMGFLHQARKGIPVILHPEAFLKRRLNVPATGIRDMPQLEERSLEQIGASLQKGREASTWCSDLILTLGEVERVTDFEKGFPWAEAKIHGKWVVDPFHDDQGIAVNIKGKGLVVLGGCSHAGIINTITYAQKASGIEKVHAVLGGFHLTGPLFEPIIGKTVDEMKRIGPDFVVPMHCTGWRAINEFSRQMPEQFLLNSVGTTYTFQN
jgi:7,8-dihydropterin-6-yl-methyl-4-(beta-D-ribofuranosyl)aminobenzene 5'-phosphate synthase